MSAFASECFFNVSICFHAEGLSNSPTREAAHSLHYPIDVTIKVVSHFSLVSSTTSHVLAGESRFETKYKTQPQNSHFGINFANDVG